MRHDETLVLGIGNTLLSDEGAGVHALYHLQAEYPSIPDTTFIDGGTLSFTLSAMIEDCDNLIVFDATELQSPPGTVKTFVGEMMDDFLGKTKRSAHEVGLLDLMDIARLTGHLPKNRALIAIQPQKLDWGTEASHSVTASLDRARDEAIELLQTWRRINIKPGIHTNLEALQSTLQLPR